MTLSEYHQLKNEVLRGAATINRHSQLISDLKEMFRDNINSPRKYEKIKTLGQLLQVLEIRDVLSESNILPLEEIAQRIPRNNQLLEQIKKYKQAYTPIECINHYASENIQRSHMEQTETFATNVPLTDWDKKKQRIIETIKDDIGTFWRDLARNLEIKERDIDEIHSKYINTSDKSKVIIEMYFRKADQQNWFFELCDALESSRRKDLVRKLKKIAVMNI